MAQMFNYFSLRPKYDYSIMVVTPHAVTANMTNWDSIISKHNLPPHYGMESTYYTVKSFLIGIDIQAKYDIPVVVILMYDDDPDHSVLIKDDELDHIVNELRSCSDEKQHAWDIIQKEHLRYTNCVRKKEMP